MVSRIGKFSKKQVLPLILGVLFAVGFAASTAEPVAAFGDGKFSEADYSASNIVYYSPSIPLCGGGSSATSLVGADNRQKIYNFWIAAGLTPNQAAGITGSMQEEGGFSPFRQEESQTWPNGGYGIAQFTDPAGGGGGQRTAVTKALSAELSATFTENYIPKYGGGVKEASGFIPDGISRDVNDQFLLVELSYLNQYVSAFAPSTIPQRVSSLSTDYSLTIPKGVKLLDYIKTLTSAGDVAKAWTYLYEFPGGRKATAATRATDAATILSMYSAASDAATGACSAVGVGGLSYDQGIDFMKTFYLHRFDYVTNPFWRFGDQRWTCTSLPYYFNTRFVTQGTGSGNGVDVVSRLLSGHASSFKPETDASIQPFSVFSIGPNEPGHTGLVLGLESDGSVIIGEANMSLGKLGPSNGLIEKVVYGSKKDENPLTGLGTASIEHWTSIQAWEVAMKSFGYPRATFAAVTDQTGVAAKIQASLTSSGTGGAV